MTDSTDPRITELEHLRLSLAETTKLFAEVELKLHSLPGRPSIRNLMDKETKFTNYVAGGTVKNHRSPERSPTPEDIENRFAVVVASCMSKKLNGG
jgi:hypothetical protein